MKQRSDRTLWNVLYCSAAMWICGLNCKQNTPVGGVAVSTASLIEKFQWRVCVVESAQLNRWFRCTQRDRWSWSYAAGNGESELSERCKIIRKLSRSDTCTRIGSASECFDLCRANDQRLLCHPNKRESKFISQRQNWAFRRRFIYLFRNRV